jgi:hypothetical protein
MHIPLEFHERYVSSQALMIPDACQTLANLYDSTMGARSWFGAKITSRFGCWGVVWWPTIGTRPAMMTLNHKVRGLWENNSNNLISTVVTIEGALEKNAQIRHWVTFFVSVQRSTYVEMGGQLE